MENPAAVDTDLVRTLADLVTTTDLSEIVVERGGLRIRVARTQPPVRRHVAGPPDALPAAAGKQAETVASPLVGTVCLRDRDGEALASVGEAVEAGDTLMLIEAMRTHGDVTAPRAGTLVAILVRDGQPVEFGQPLAEIL